MNVDNTKEFKCLSLCSGYGGLELGLRQVISNLRTITYVEVEAFACANLVAKMEKGFLDAAPIWTDIKTFDGRQFRGKVDIVTAGYPCQPFSVAGQRKGTDDPRHLWPHIERILEAVRPVWCFFENVSGHLTIGFPEVYRSLRNLGYKVEAGLFSAAECNFSHIRERLFFLAYSKQQRLETHRVNWSSTEIYKSQSSNQNNCIDAIKRFWDTAFATVGRNDGTSCRVDRLRLLGNGVVPQQAEKAFRELLREL